MTYTISAWFRKAEVVIDNLPVLIKKHRFWEQVCVTSLSPSLGL